MSDFHLPKNLPTYQKPIVKTAAIITTKIRSGAYTPSDPSQHDFPFSKADESYQGAGIYTSVKMERSVAEVV